MVPVCSHQNISSSDVHMFIRPKYGDSQVTGWIPRYETSLWKSAIYRCVSHSKRHWIGGISTSNWPHHFGSGTAWRYEPSWDVQRIVPRRRGVSWPGKSPNKQWLGWSSTDGKIIQLLNEPEFHGYVKLPEGNCIVYCTAYTTYGNLRTVSKTIAVGIPWNFGLTVQRPWDLLLKPRI